MTTSPRKIDGQVRYCRLSNNRMIYFIRSRHCIRATIYDVGEWHIGMFIIGWRKRYLDNGNEVRGK